MGFPYNWESGQNNYLFPDPNSCWEYGSCILQSCGRITFSNGQEQTALYSSIGRNTAVHVTLLKQVISALTVLGN